MWRGWIRASIGAVPIRLLILAALISGGCVIASGCALERSGFPEDSDASGMDAGRVDAAVPDGCIPGPGPCSGSDDGCDGVIDEGFDLLTDPARCGACILRTAAAAALSA